MSGPAVIEYRGRPVYRVVRRNWSDPLDDSFSRRQTTNRWNTPDFAALYCCSSEAVARAVTLDLFRMVGVELTDLRPEIRPQLTEIEWEGTVVDMCSAEGVTAAGFPPEYPSGVPVRMTQRAATVWHEDGREGVVCRSASLARLGFDRWSGAHERWSEVAIFGDNAVIRPRLRARREDFDWLLRARSAP